MSDINKHHDIKASNDQKLSFYAFDYPMSSFDKKAYNILFDSSKTPTPALPKYLPTDKNSSISDMTTEFMKLGNAIIEKANESSRASSSTESSKEKNLELIKLRESVKILNKKLSNNFKASKRSFKSLSKDVESSKIDRTSIRDEMIEMKAKFNTSMNNFENKIMNLEKENLKLRNQENVELQKKANFLETKIKQISQTTATLYTAAEQKKKIKKKDDVEDEILLRLAAFGNDRIEHMEILGNGERTTDGTSIRKICLESNLGDEKLGLKKFKPPSSWKSNSDSKTINLNFEVITRMFNDVVLKRIDNFEDNVENKIDTLDKKVSIIQNLMKDSKMKARIGVNDDSGEKLEESPKKNYQPSASAGRAAFNRRNGKEKVKIH